jgi:hypothetical protein
MAQSRGENRTDRQVAEAIAQVLDAERRARTDVAAAQAQAETLRADARARDKRVAERAAARIAVIRAGMAEKRATRLATLEAEAVGPDPQTAEDEAARGRLDHAVAQLADELIGKEPAE